MFVPLSTSDVYAKWDWLRNGLQECAAKTVAHQRPEDVYVRLRTNTAWAYAIRQDDEDVGFIIFTQEHDADGLVLFIFAFWTGKMLMSKWHSEIQGELESMARKVGAKRIRMHGRDGWQKESFFKHIASIYEHEVT